MTGIRKEEYARAPGLSLGNFIGLHYRTGWAELGRVKEEGGGRQKRIRGENSLLPENIPHHRRRDIDGKRKMDNWPAD